MKSMHPFKILIEWKWKCDEDTDFDDAAAAADDNADGQHDPYVSAMLHRRHTKNGFP